MTEAGRPRALAPLWFALAVSVLCAVLAPRVVAAPIDLGKINIVAHSKAERRARIDERALRARMSAEKGMGAEKGKGAAWARDEKDV